MAKKGGLYPLNYEDYNLHNDLCQVLGGMKYDYI